MAEGLGLHQESCLDQTRCEQEGGESRSGGGRVIPVSVMVLRSTSIAGALVHPTNLFQVSQEANPTRILEKGFPNGSNFTEANELGQCKG